MIAEHVDHRNGADSGHSLDNAVIEHPRSQQAVVAGHHAGDVFDRLTNVETNLFAAGVHRMSTQLHDGHLHRLPGAVRWLLEDQGDAEPTQHLGHVALLGEVQHMDELVRREVADVEQMPHASTLARMPTASSSSSSVTVSGGANRREVAVTALVTRPASSSFAYTALASAPSGELCSKQQTTTTHTGYAGQRATAWS